LAVLECAECGASLVLGIEDAIVCPSCGASTPVPQAYRDLQRARRDDPAARAQAERVLRKLDRPPSMVVKVLARCLDLPMLAFLMLYGVPLGLFAILEADRFNRWLAPRLHLESANDVPFGYMVAMMFGILLVVAFIPRAFGVYANRRVTGRSRLLAALRARQPKVAGAAAECRTCGAPLAVAPDAIVATCSYCGSENAIVIETAVAETAQGVVRNLGATMADAAQQDRAERRATVRMLGAELARYTFRTILLGGLFVLGSQETPDHKSTNLGIAGLVAFVFVVFVFIFRSAKFMKTDDAAARRAGNDVPSWVGIVGPILMAYVMFKVVAAVAF
jgi:Zn finger protein HypA/HybF involved in hydrogenase expression